MLIVVVLVAIEYFCSFACLLFCSWNGFQATPTFPFLYGSFFIYHTLTCYGKYHAKWRHRDFIDGVDWLYLYNFPLPTFRLQFSYFHTTPIFGTLFQFENYQYIHSLFNVRTANYLIIINSQMFLKFYFTLYEPRVFVFVISFLHTTLYKYVCVY